MNNKHLTYFKVENFKRFEELELTNIGQFNLLVGDNNVGKTSLLEALSVFNIPSSNPKLSLDQAILCNLGFSLFRRGVQIEQNVELFFKYLSFDSNKEIKVIFKQEKHTQDCVFLVKKSQLGGVQVSLWSEEADQKKDEYTSAASYFINNSSFIPATIDFTQNLVEDYQKALVEAMSNKRLIINNLKTIDKNVVEIEVLPIMDKNHVMIGFNNKDLYIPITAMGESAVRVFYYLLHLIKNANQHLLIDEVDTGIHYSRMKNFLKNIIILADKNNVQLFLSTHSLECQQAFVEVFEDSDMLQYQKKVRQFTLIETPEHKVIASGRSFEQLQNAIEIGYETRGGR